MAVTDASTPGGTQHRLVITPEARATLRQLAREYADEVLDRRVRPAITLADHRHAIRVLAHQLELVDDQAAINVAGVARARQALAAARTLCPSSGEFIRSASVDGNRITTCPECRRYRPAVHVTGDWWAVSPHRACHAAACLANGPLRCVCALNDNEEPF